MFMLTVLGWRRPPVDGTGLGNAALASEPHIMQCFVGKTPLFASEDMERHLVLLRKLTQTKLGRPSDFYIASLSSRTITYKGQLTPAQLPEYYLDLVHPMMKVRTT
jgi:glutamate synthase domain-containing protein 1